MTHHKIILGDCLEGLGLVNGGEVDLAFTDPPYNVGKDYGAHYNDSKPDYEYLSDVEGWLSRIAEVSKAMAILTPQVHLLSYWQILGRGFRPIIILAHAEGPIMRGMGCQHQTVLTNAKPLTYCRDVWDGIRTRRDGYFFRENDFGHDGYTPESLTRKVIQHFSKEGDTILDPFAGTFTTSKVARDLGRNSISIEINPDYWHNIGETRLKANSPTLDNSVTFEIINLNEKEKHDGLEYRLPE